MKLYDCCMYFDEDFMLDLRLNILNDYVSIVIAFSILIGLPALILLIILRKTIFKK